MRIVGNVARTKKMKDFKRVVALAGNSNVGKSAIFNQLTGMDQIIGNWPGKTVERAEGLLQYRGIEEDQDNRPTRNILVLHILDGRNRI